MSTTPTQRALLSGIIDYAGLFPPASLDLPEALANHIEYMAGPDRWMLGRFVLPADSLDELEVLLATMLPANNPPLRLSLLVGDASSAVASLEKIREQAARSAHSVERSGGSIVIEALETRIPANVAPVGTEASLDVWLVGLDGVLEQEGLKAVELFVEQEPGAHLSEMASQTIDAISQFSMTARPGAVGRTGYKIRCGGLAAHQHPDATTIAIVIEACHNRDVPLKLTAGLHHPLTRGTEHGFINVFTAAALAQSDQLSRDKIVECLTDSNGSSFELTEALRWKDRTATAEQITRSRARLATGFGSCSFDEPRDDLRALGLLTE